jgi:Asp/Glu/hydantoin racemase
MKKEELKALSLEELEKKRKSSRTMIVILGVLGLALLLTQLREYLVDGTVETSILIITLCTFGGMASVYPGLKLIREEIQDRES